MQHVSRFTSVIQVAAMLYLLATGQLLSRSPFVLVPQLAALVLVVWARRAFPQGQFSVHAAPRGDRLVEAGPYRYIRHPMYTAGQLVLWPGILSHPSALTIAIGLVVVFAVIARVMTEEPLLHAKVPGYADYARRTKRFVPYVF